MWFAAALVNCYFSRSHNDFHAMESRVRKPPNHIHCRGLRFEIQDELSLRGRTYWVVGKFGNRGRRKLQVFDPAVQNLRVVHFLPRANHTKQLVRVLRRVGRLDGFVGVCDVLHRRSEVLVVTEWVWGETLASYLKQAKDGKKRWPSGFMAWKLYAGFVHAISKFHDFTMCAHGDIKPQNVVIQSEGRRLKLIDFGSAWHEERAKERETGDGHAVGYAAPELRHRDGKATVLADQFSATLLFYEMISGKLPYEGMGGRAGWAEFRDSFASTFIPPSSVCRGDGDLPKTAWTAIDKIVAQGLALSAEARFPTTNAWRDAVDEVTRMLDQTRNQPSWRKRFVDIADGWLDYFTR